MINLPPPPASLPNPLRKLAAFIVTVMLAGLVLMFSAVLFAAILVAGAIAWVYLWWKTRDLRKQMRSFPSRNAGMEGEVVAGEEVRGEVIEGEVIRVVDTREELS
jgi:Flp pilus assembly protein TadB